jgi:hypothetical protein
MRLFAFGRDEVEDILMLERAIPSLACSGVEAPTNVKESGSNPRGLTAWTGSSK